MAISVETPKWEEVVGLSDGSYKKLSQLSIDLERRLRTFFPYLLETSIKKVNTKLERNDNATLVVTGGRSLDAYLNLQSRLGSNDYDVHIVRLGGHSTPSHSLFPPKPKRDKGKDPAPKPKKDKGKDPIYVSPDKIKLMEYLDGKYESFSAEWWKNHNDKQVQIRVLGHPLDTTEPPEEYGGADITMVEVIDDLYKKIIDELKSKPIILIYMRNILKDIGLPIINESDIFLNIIVGIYKNNGRYAIVFNAPLWSKSSLPIELLSVDFDENINFNNETNISLCYTPNEINYIPYCEITYNLIKYLDFAEGFKKDKINNKILTLESHVDKRIMPFSPQVIKYCQKVNHTEYLNTYQKLQDKLADKEKTTYIKINSIFNLLLNNTHNIFNIFEEGEINKIRIFEKHSAHKPKYSQREIITDEIWRSHAEKISAIDFTNLIEKSQMNSGALTDLILTTISGTYNKNIIDRAASYYGEHSPAEIIKAMDEIYDYVSVRGKYPDESFSVYRLTHYFNISKGGFVDINFFEKGDVIPLHFYTSTSSSFIYGGLDSFSDKTSSPTFVLVIKINPDIKDYLCIRNVTPMFFDENEILLKRGNYLVVDRVVNENITYDVEGIREGVFIYCTLHSSKSITLTKRQIDKMKNIYDTDAAKPNDPCEFELQRLMSALLDLRKVVDGLNQYHEGQLKDVGTSSKSSEVQPEPAKVPTTAGGRRKLRHKYYNNK